MTFCSIENKKQVCKDNWQKIKTLFNELDRKELFIRLILLFPVTTLFQNHISFLNKLLFFVSVFVLIAIKKLRKKVLVYLMGVVALWIFSVCNTPLGAFKVNLNMTFYYIFLVFYLVFFLDNQEEIWRILNKNKKYIYAIVVFYTVVVAISIFLPSSYSTINTGGWGDNKYFMSISASPNRVGPASLYIVILLTFLLHCGYPKRIIMLAIPQAYVFLMGGSRTYFVLGMCSLVILYYVFLKNKRKFFMSIIPLGMVLLFLTLQSSMMDKFMATFQSNITGAEFWRRLTNSRSVFWVKQLQLFFDTSIINQIFGNGINFTTYNYGLWAHSDFIEILCSYGYVGLINYIVLMIYSITTMIRGKKKNYFIKCVAIFIWFFNAFFNFFYCYFCAVLAYPILLLNIKHID